MKCLRCRTEVFGDGDIEICSYGIEEIEDPNKALSVYKAQIIRKIEDLRHCDIPDYFKGKLHTEDRFYIYDLSKNKKNIETIKNEFRNSVFPDNKPVFAEHSIPEGWEEIIPEDYEIQEVAFKKKYD